MYLHEFQYIVKQEKTASVHIYIQFTYTKMIITGNYTMQLDL